MRESATSLHPLVHGLLYTLQGLFGQNVRPAKNKYNPVPSSLLALGWSFFATANVTVKQWRLDLETEYARSNGTNAET